jgi:S1-C subfamily serine protease
LQRDDDTVLILTNRHVVDMRFTESQGAQDTPLKDIPKLKVTYFDQQSNPGSVIWLAPNRIDLAIVKAKAPSEIQPVDWQSMPPVSSGQDVFAVGNPVGLDWSLTKGVVSQVRKAPFGSEGKTIDLPIIQTDATLTYGNSGGGLYTHQGQLIGINSAIVHPLLGNAGFSIRVSVLMDLKPTGLKLPDRAESKEAGATKTPESKK